jgi:hypothetical protein
MLVWAAKCKNEACGELSVVRQSKSTLGQIEVLSPSEQIVKHQCQHCGYVNDFLGYELQEVDAHIAPSPEKFGGG